ncbi:MAG: hypothetical protein ABI411_14875 [Tahibacter sp.]
MLTVIASNVPGPLPLTLPFNSPLDGPVTFAFSSTAWSNTTPGTTIGVDILLDSVLIGTTVMSSNNPGEHRTLPTQIVGTKITDGPHKITVQAHNANTITDQNDYFSVWIID